MNDIFISYANEDRPRARRLAEALASQGWSIFWDRTIPPGKTWRDVIGAALEQTRCVVVLWSAASIDSDWVQEEADEGRARGILIPVLIESVRPPIGFRSFQTADLSNWDGSETAPGLESFITELIGVIGAAPVGSTLEERPMSGVEPGGRQSTPRLLPWSHARTATWLGIAALLVLVVGGFWYSGYQYSEGERQAVLAAFPPGKTFKECPDCPELVVVPPGSFLMGSAEKRQHRVTITQPFAVGKYEVTFAEWDVCVAKGGCAERPEDQGWGRGRRPVINVNWQEAKAYVRWLSQEIGVTYRLLSEAEWEYAARAGTKTRYAFGDEVSKKDANFGTELGKTTEVGAYPANAWGLHDMHGNVEEWVEDCWNDSYKDAPSDGSAWTSGDCKNHVKRGGSWVHFPEWTRSSWRSRVIIGSGDGGLDLGFRVARTLP